MTLRLPLGAPSQEGRSAGLKSLFKKVDICKKCPKVKNRKSSCVRGIGNINRPKLAFVAGFPTELDEDMGKPLADGRIGIFADLLEIMKLDEEGTYLTYAVKCPGDTNHDDTIKSCQPFILEELSIVRPTVVIALGQTAAQVVTNSSKSMEGLRGRWLDAKLPNKEKIPVRVTFTLGAASRYPAIRSDMLDDIQMAINWVTRNRND